MIPTTAIGFAYLCLAAFVVGFGWSAGCWLRARLLK